jgi:nicotinamidase-related amidase
MLRIENTVLIVVDVQGKLASLMYDKETLFENIKKCIKGAKVLEIPILWVEQNPNGLGKTIPEIANLLGDREPIVKMSFSSYKNKDFKEALKDLNRNQILIVGIETHVCVYQTAVDLVNADFEVNIVADAVSSRKQEDKQIGIQKMKDEGVKLTSTEMALFELQEVAEGSRFKQIIKIVK